MTKPPGPVLCLPVNCRATVTKSFSLHCSFNLACGDTQYLDNHHQSQNGIPPRDAILNFIYVLAYWQLYARGSKDPRVMPQHLPTRRRDQLIDWRATKV